MDFKQSVYQSNFTLSIFFPKKNHSFEVIKQNINCPYYYTLFLPDRENTDRHFLHCLIEIELRGWEKAKGIR